MNKVGYLTSHASMNYGGLLQAYALRETILSMGYECEIINYMPQVHDIKKHPLQFVLQRKDFVEKTIFGLLNHKALKDKMETIERFRRNFFLIKPNDAVGVERLPEISKEYDILCVGSDQLWNLNQKDNENRVYMLDFEHSCRSFSYAISFGDGLQEKKNKIEDALPLIERFSAVSVREQEGAAFLRLHDISAEVVLDPTLMVDTAFWDQFRGKKPIVDHPYILVYGFENANQKYEDLIVAARKASNMLNLPVVNPILSPALGKAKFENYYNCGPIEFLNLIENATLLVTNSFHGSIFSVLFGTPFIAVKGRNSGKDSRKGNLLAMLKMENRLVFPDEEWDLSRTLITEYDDVETILDEPRRKSKEYLKEALKRCEL